MRSSRSGTPTGPAIPGRTDATASPAPPDDRRPPTAFVREARPSRRSMTGTSGMSDSGSKSGSASKNVSTRAIRPMPNSDQGSDCSVAPQHGVERLLVVGGELRPERHAFGQCARQHGEPLDGEPRSQPVADGFEDPVVGLRVRVGLVLQALLDGRADEGVVECRAGRTAGSDHGDQGPPLAVAQGGVDVHRSGDPTQREQGGATFLGAAATGLTDDVDDGVDRGAARVTGPPDQFVEHLPLVLLLAGPDSLVDHGGHDAASRLGEDPVEHLREADGFEPEADRRRSLLLEDADPGVEHLFPELGPRAAWSGRAGWTIRGRIAALRGGIHVDVTVDRGASPGL